MLKKHFAVKLLVAALSAWLLIVQGSSFVSGRSSGDVEISVAILPYGEAFFGQMSPRFLNFGSDQAHFPVVITNRSNRPLEFFTDGNSWGDRTLTFTVTGPQGKQMVITNSTMAYSKNFPGTVRLQPGESWSRDIYYARRPWPGFMDAKTAFGRVPVKLRVDLDQRGAEFKKAPYVWRGHARSPEIEVTLDR